MLVLCLLITVSLLIGVSLQHFQLLSKMTADDEDNEEAENDQKEKLLAATTESSINATTRFLPYIMPADRWRRAGTAAGRGFIFNG